MSQAPPYHPPGRRLQPPPISRTNGLGIAGFVVSLTGMVLCGGVICPIGLILSLIAVFKRPRGFAIAGLILGVLGSVLWGILWVVWIMNMPSYFTTNELWMAQDEIDMYHYNNNALPDDAEGQRLVAGFVDDWKTGYSYRYIDANNYEIISAGPDMQFGTPDDQATPMTPQVPWSVPYQNPTQQNTTSTVEAMAQAQATIERTFGKDYESPPWHEVQDTLLRDVVDEWGGSIRYNAGEGKIYELRSAGMDGVMGTEDDIVQTYELGARAEDEASGGAGIVQP